MLILSMDLGKFKTDCCFYETTTRKYRFVTIETKWRHVENLFSLEKTDLIVMEACGPSGWISDICHEKKLKVVSRMLAQRALLEYTSLYLPIAVTCTGLLTPHVPETDYWPAELDKSMVGRSLFRLKTANQT